MVQQSDELKLLGYLNSTLVAFYLEMFGNKNMGQGVLDFFMADFLAMRMPVVYNSEIEQVIIRMKDRPIHPVWQEYGLEETEDVKHRSVKPLADRQNLDGIIYDALQFTKGEREAVYEAVISLVETRLKKASSLDPKQLRSRGEAVRKTVGIWSDLSAGSDDDESPGEE